MNYGFPYMGNKSKIAPEKKGGVIMTYEEFCEIIRAAIASGEIKVTDGTAEVELTDLDLAIQYALGQEMEEHGGELYTTEEEIYFLIGKHCGADVQSKVFSD